jgi:hypothetical protein
VTAAPELSPALRDPRWADLSERGFVVVRGLLTSAQVEGLRAAYARSERVDVAAYVATEPRRSDVQELVACMEALLPSIRRETGMATDVVVPQGTFFATERMNLDWHSDRKSDHLYQGHLHHLTFWTPVEKPDATRSGLSVIPMDRLREHAPDAFRALRGRGSARYASGVLEYEEGNRERRLACPVDLASFAESPHLVPGDMLVVRSDVLHRTSDVETVRVALTLRALSGEHRLTLAGLLSGTSKKHARILGEPNAFAEVLSAFFLSRRRAITVRELLDVRARLARKELLPRVAFAAARLALPLALAASDLPRRT